MLNERFFTTKQYLDYKEQEDLDELFDNAINEARQKELQEMESKEHGDYVVDLITKIGDYESELTLLQNLYKEEYESKDCGTGNLATLKREIKTMKVRLTRIKHELDNILVQENAK